MIIVIAGAFPGLRAGFNNAGKKRRRKEEAAAFVLLLNHSKKKGTDENDSESISPSAIEAELLAQPTSILMFLTANEHEFEILSLFTKKWKRPTNCAKMANGLASFG